MYVMGCGCAHHGEEGKSSREGVKGNEGVQNDTKHAKQNHSATSVLTPM